MISYLESVLSFIVLEFFIVDAVVFFKTVLLCIALAVLELTVQTRRRLCLPRAGLKGMHCRHHPAFYWFKSDNFFYYLK